MKHTGMLVSGTHMRRKPGPQKASFNSGCFLERHTDIRCWCNTQDRIRFLPRTKKHSMRQALPASKRCRCGACAVCRDNARWERIFQEKYGQQEREYYSAERRTAGVSANALVEASVYAMAEESSSSSRQRAENALERLFRLAANGNDQSENHAA
jgi:hypothetical protein